MASGVANRQRRSIRLPDYDYGDAGGYFITLTLHNRRCIFGDVAHGVMVLNDTGRIVDSEWSRTPTIRLQVALDEYVVMPNHFHALIAIESSRRGVSLTPSDKFHSPSQTLGAIVRGFKSATTKVINQMRGTPGIPVWQRNYYEHVVRNDGELKRVREYIVNNPIQWTLDRENPETGVYHYAPTDGIESIFGGVRP